MQPVEAFLTAAFMARDEDGYRREDLEKVLCNAVDLQRWVDAGYLSMKGKVGSAGNGVAVAYTPLVANAFVEVMMSTTSWKPVEMLAVMVPMGELAKKPLERVFARAIFGKVEGVRALRTALVGKKLRALEGKADAALTEEVGKGTKLEVLDYKWPERDVQGNRDRCVGKIFWDSQDNIASVAVHHELNVG
jgi:hypothetical protein